MWKNPASERDKKKVPGIVSTATPIPGVAVIIYGVWVGAWVEVRLAVGVKGIGESVSVVVGVVVDAGIDPQAERKNRMHIAEINVRDRNLLEGC